MIESIRDGRAVKGQLPLTFSQEMGLIRKWYTPRKDNTCLNAELKVIQWNGKRETIGKLVADVMWTLTMNYPS